MYQKIAELIAKYFDKVRQPWMKNSSGKADAMLTFACVGLFITSVTVILSVMEKITLGKLEIALKSPSETLILGFLSATLGAYVWRRNVKDGIEHRETLAGVPPKEEEKIEP